MASVNTRNGQLFFDFRYRGVRCREYTRLPDTPANRRKMEAALRKLEAAITLGQFRYGEWFPGSRNADRFESAPVATPPADGRSEHPHHTPLFRDFADTWVMENTVAWRRSHAATVRSTLERHLKPAFGDRPLAKISKADALQFRSTLTRVKGRSGNASLSAKTINRIMQILSQVMAEAADRYDFNNPVANIKRIKQRRVDIHPFSLNEVRRIIATVRDDYRNYMIVRFFTGMRTGELHGLKWKYVDFERGQILVRETIVRGQNEYTKTDGSQREIDMSQPVRDALRAQQAATGAGEYVFCNRHGDPLDVDNVTNRVWYPLLRHLGLDARRPYQTRHTAATLWLGAGENPEWVARQLGHSDTTMLFRVYSRYVPNLTRQDGSAFDRLVSTELTTLGASRDLR